MCGEGGGHEYGKGGGAGRHGGGGETGAEEEGAQNEKVRLRLGAERGKHEQSQKGPKPYCVFVYT